LECRSHGRVLGLQQLTQSDRQLGARHGRSHQLQSKRVERGAAFLKRRREVAVLEEPEDRVLQHFMLGSFFLCGMGFVAHASLSMMNSIASSSTPAPRLSRFKLCVWTPLLENRPVCCAPLKTYWPFSRPPSCWSIILSNLNGEDEPPNWRACTTAMISRSTSSRTPCSSSRRSEE